MTRFNAALALSAALAAQAAEIHVVAPSAARDAMAAAVPRFENQTRDKVVLEYVDGDELLERASKDERVDAAILPVAQMGVLARAYRIMPDTKRTLGRTAATAESPQGNVLLVAALSGGDHEESARSFCAYLGLPETVLFLRKGGLSAP